MMAKIKQGTSFANAVNYVLNRDEAYVMALRGIRDGTKQEMIHSFEIEAQMNPLAKPVAHISLNFSKEDSNHLTDHKMMEIAQEYMQKMGYRNTQYLMVRHTDREHPHLHLIINRVDFDGKRISDKNERIRNIKVTQELTHKHRLFISSGKDNVKRHRLRGSEKTRYEIYDALKKHIPNSKSWSELEYRLNRDGIGVEFKYNGSTEKVQGVKFSKDNQTFNGSKVDKQFSYSKIDFTLQQNARVEAQAQYQSSMQSQQQQFQHQEQEQFSTGIGLFDLPQAPADDFEEDMFRRQMQKKKKRGIRM